MVDADGLKVKGSNFLSMHAAVRGLRGDAVAQEVLKQLQGPCGESMRMGLLLASGWYPYAWYREFLDCVRRVTGEGDVITTLVSKEAIRRDVGGVYRMIFKLLSPATLFAQGGKSMRAYYDRGDFKVVETRDGYLRARFEGFTGFDRLGWLDVRAGAEQLLEMSGARDIRHRVVSGGEDGHAHLEVEVTWKAR